ncbi:protein of unknown function [Rhizobiales bacterium GAS188]|nr:protein of unknown function [Rhizobiales bacterium GAS188]
MNSLFLWRLTLDFLAAGLLLIGLSYWWLGDTVHEVAGTGMFVLLIAHNLFNRRWYGAAFRTRRDARGTLNVGATLLLLTAMFTLLVTSAVISNTLTKWIPHRPSFTVRQLHVFAAYWALVIVAIHLGCRWPMIMGVARTLCRISTPSKVRTLGLRIVAAAVALHGLRSWFALGLGTRLTMQVSLDWWNFEDSVTGFFVHCVAIAGLCIAATYYAMRWRKTSYLSR